ncbi:MAG: DNA topoisomerase [Candidatus Micrarchaeota archaeon]
MANVLLLAEKPQAAAKIAAALAEGQPRQLRRKQTYWFEFERGGNHLFVVPAVGHLYGLRSTEKGYGYPSFEVEWAPSSEISKTSAFTKDYLKNIEALSKKADEFVAATDWDLEGEVIAANILEYGCGVKNPKRMYFSTLVAEDLVDAFENAKPQDKKAVEAGRTRHEVDWIWGINLSRALMAAIKKAGAFRVMSVGRVQGPALALLAKKEKEIAAFKPEPYWQLFAHELPHELRFTHEEDKFFEKEKAQAAYENSLAGQKNARVTSVEKKEYRQSPPAPFDLTTLQLEAYRAFGLPPTQTLQVAQELYEAAAISYPRTASEKLPAKLNLQKIISKLAENPAYADLAKKLISGKRFKPHEGKKEDPAHPCFPADTVIQLADGIEKSFEELTENAKWRFDREHKSFYSPCAEDVWVLAWNARNGAIAHAEVNGFWRTPSPFANLLKITLESRESVVLTPNHEVGRFNGKSIEFVQARSLKEGDVLAMKPCIRKTRRKIILTEKEFVCAYSREQRSAFECKVTKDSPPPASRKTIEKMRNFFPLYSDSQRAVLLARLVGHLVGDGHIAYEKAGGRRNRFPKSMFLSDVNGLAELLRDIRELGFSTNKPIKRGKVLVCFSSNAALNRVLIALGAPCGDKVVSKFSIPAWIEENAELSRAFLQAYLGAELAKPQANSRNPRDLRELTVVMSKVAETLDSGKHFFKQLKRGLARFGIETSKIKVRSKSMRTKDGKQTYQLSFYINNQRENLLRFFTEVGYAYCGYKEQLAEKATAYLLARKVETQKRARARNQAKLLYRRGSNAAEIARQLNMPHSTVKGWLFCSKGGKDSEHVPIALLKEWRHFHGNASKMRYASVATVSIKRSPRFVYDLEVKGCHTYFANSLLVHNCVHPTGQKPGSLPDYQRKVYDLVVKRFLACFAPEAKRESATVRIALGSEPYAVSGARTVEPGWIEFYAPYADFDEVTLPPFKQGQQVEIEKVEMAEKETQPPKRYTQASLVKKLEDLELGTKATRAAIIQTLFDRGYAVGKSIEATPLGMTVYDALHKSSPEILSEEMTRGLEKEMDEIQEGRQSHDAVVADSRKELAAILSKFKPKEEAVGQELMKGLRSTQYAAAVLGKCSKCEKGMLVLRRSKFGYFVGCNAYPACRNLYPLPKEAVAKPTGKTCEKCGTPIVTILRKGKRPFRMCLDTKCETKKNWGRKEEG